MKYKNRKEFKNGCIYLYETNDGYPFEITDTFLPYYTKNAINQRTNALIDDHLGSRHERWMVGVSTMSGCPVKCKFCATGKLKRCRNLSFSEIVGQVLSVTVNSDYSVSDSKEFKINYTRMGEPFLNINNVKTAIDELSYMYPGAHHYISTIGIKDSDFSWIKDDITLQISLHSFNEKRRNWLIPYKNKMSIEELGQIRTKSNLKTTLNLTLVDEEDFDINILKEYFDPRYFFIKLSPINQNIISKKNKIEKGIINYERNN